MSLRYNQPRTLVQYSASVCLFPNLLFNSPMRILFTNFVCVVCFFSFSAAFGQVDIDKGGWSVVFEDDFNDPNTVSPLSPSKKWYDGYYFGGLTHQLGSNIAYYSADNVSIRNGTAEFATQDVSSNPISTQEVRTDTNPVRLPVNLTTRLIPAAEPMAVRSATMAFYTVCSK